MSKLISVGQIIDNTWEHYLTHFKGLMKVSAWAFVVAALVLARLLLLPNGETQTIAMIAGGSATFMTYAGFIISVIISLIAVPVVSLWIYMNLVRGIGAQANKKPHSANPLQRQSWTDFFAFLWVTILRVVFTLLPLIIIAPGLYLTASNLIGEPSYSAGMTGLILTFAGLLIAFILVILIGVRIGFSSFTCLLADYRGTQAIKASFAIVKNRFWATLWRLLLPKVVFGAGILIVEVLVTIASGLLIAALLNTYGTTFVFYLGMLISAVLTTGVRVLYTPLFIIADYLVYDSLRR